MKQSEFDQLLAWTMLVAQNTGIIVQQNQAGRPLTQEELDAEVHKAHDVAEILAGHISQSRT
ncbi:MAG TPA: hypothetical protein DCP69_07885 [Candidatus Omnitrophica bacterium]|nr:hypothetical protein [Candidatus Omnitrophota bacterium]